MGAHGVARCGNLRKKLRPGIAAPSLETAGLHSALEIPALRSASADATAHERCLRGDNFGDGFGADFSPLGRSTGGDSAPVLTSVALSEVGSPGSLRLRVAGSSPASRASNQRPLDHMCWSLVSREPRLTRVVWCTFRSIRPGSALPKFSA